MGKKLQDKALNFLNASILPLLIFIVSRMHLAGNSPDLDGTAQLLACPTTLSVALITTFALGYVLLNHLRWPFIIMSYAAGGIIAFKAYTHFYSEQILNPYVLGVYALIGATLVFSCRDQFHILFIKKINLPSAIWLFLIIAGDAVITNGFKDSFFTGSSLDWRINAISLAAGAIVGIIAYGSFSLLRILVRTEDARKMLNRLVYRSPAQQTLLASGDPSPVKARDAEITPVTPKNKTEQPPPSNITSKLLSRTDLPQIKSAAKIKPNVPVPPPKNPQTPLEKNSSDTDSDWLQKHLSSLD